MACRDLDKRKSSWPELVGVPGTEAEATIERENPRVNAVVVKVGTGVPENFDCGRVWVWVDRRGIVAQTPRIG